MDDSQQRRLPDRLRLEDGADLVLRRFRQEDLPDIYDQCQDAEMQHWTTIPVPYERSDAEGFLVHVASAWEQDAAATLAIDFEGRFAGSIDLRLKEANWGEAGYALAAWARGRHVMSRSVRLLLRWGFADLGLAGVHWRAHVGNEGSRRVALACGFRIEGAVRGLLAARGHRIDGWIGSILPSELTSEQRPTH